MTKPNAGVSAPGRVPLSFSDHINIWHGHLTNSIQNVSVVCLPDVVGIVA